MSGKRPFDFCPDLFARSFVAVSNASRDLLAHGGEASTLVEFVGCDSRVSGLAFRRGHESLSCFSGAKNHISDFAGDAQYFRAENNSCHNRLLI